MVDLSSVETIEKEMPAEERWTAKTVYEQLCQTTAKHGNRPAVSFQLTSGDRAKATTLTWHEIKTQVTKAANLFRSLGVGQKDVVAYMLPTSHETAITLAGAMTAGIAAPVNPTLKPEQIAALLQETGAKVLVTLKAFPKTNVARLAHDAVTQAPNVNHVIEIDLLPHLSGLKKFIVPLIRPKMNIRHKATVLEFNSALAAQPGDRLTFKESPDDPVCAYFHTGGTTGMPKIAQHKHSGILYNGFLGANLLINEKDTILCPLPMFHVMAANVFWATSISAGSHIVFPTPAGYRGDGVFDNFWKLVERWGATYTAIVPTAASRLMQCPVNADISTLQGAMCGSAPLPTDIFKRFEEIAGIKILEGYGMTEATCLISGNPMAGERKIGSVGIRNPYCDIKICDCDKDGNVLRDCGVDEVGEICVSNPGVWTGNTYTDACKNVGLFANGTHLRTGDLGRFDADGYLWITGRAKDMIIRSGHNIDPAIIEEVLAAHPDVAFSGVIGQPDADAGELPAAYVELVKGSTATVDALMTHCKEHVHDPAAVPKYLELAPELPKTAVGKIFKPDLRRSAITRVYNAELAAAGVAAEVEEVIEDSRRGLVARIRENGVTTGDDVNGVLGVHIFRWEWAD
ncbi:MAG: acyl-CoA synthetase [Rhodobacteraceae bacterium]|nr:acyl-CoA synthetase [Paracoccaceae bacterium]